MTDLDELCPMCGKSNDKHSSEEQSRCSKKAIDLGIMRYCEFCGLTKPAKGMHDRCSKCDEKYPFSNH
ncbi:hypothetical protein [Nitrosarchaeum sp.]|uniref:hypothetical protein n=1 Tax=Nitrosarchaeum sp. TaxID=2026886 RepID=UPI00247F0C82|nr:hypothetical protein [Nitrosarchaeum sp.]MCV0412810.1 hypothetical protein [Nitrosarchaeum sp.]